MTDEIDFIAEYPKADMSKVHRIIVNGRMYLAVDAVFGAINQVRDEVIEKKQQTLSPEWNCYVTADAYLCDVANKVESLRHM